MPRTRLIKLSLEPTLEDGQLPAEFQIFSAGTNRSSKGSFLFDEPAATTLIEAYTEHGADLMIDLEHLSLEDPKESRNFDPDARAWFSLEVRQGALWATNVRWTPDGARRLTERTQRYISPAFLVEEESGRIVQLINVALTAIPATHQLAPLIAASRRKDLSAMDGIDPNSQQSEAENADLGEAVGVDLAALCEALGIEPSSAPVDIAAAARAFVDQLEAEAGIKAPEVEAEAVEATEDEKDEAKALRSALFRETDTKTALQALSRIAAWKSSHLAIEADRKVSAGSQNRGFLSAPASWPSGS